MKTMRPLLAGVLRQKRFTVVHACDGVQGVYEMQQQIDVVVTDYHMPRLTGFDLFRQSHMAWYERPVMLFPGIEWDKTELTEARGAFAWVCQSSEPGVLLSMLALALEQDAKCGNCGAQWNGSVHRRVGA